MALTQIQILSSGRVIWAKLSQAAKLVAQGRARYIVTAAEDAPEAAPPAPAPAPRPRASRKGRR